MPSPVLQFKRGALNNLPGLRAGEPALTTDTYDLYVGIDSTTNNNKFFGSHRYWTKGTASTGSGINLVEGTTNGSSYITLKSPDSLAGVTTYTFPETPTNGYFLKTNASGTLSWDQVISDFYIAADSGSPDTVSTGSTITFVGGTNVNTAVTDQTITVNLDSGISLTDVNASGIITAADYYVGGTKVLSNPGSLTLSGIQTVDATTKATLEAILGSEPNTFSSLLVSGISTFQGAIDANGGATIDNIQIGVTNDNKIDTVSGVLELDSAGGKVIIQDHTDIYGDLNVTGNVSIGGTTITLRGADVFIENRDIVLGYSTTSSPTDDTANHGGVAIASTEGTPLVSFSASGINTFPDTYKQMMWFQSGTLGFQEDMFAFNYGVAIGTTTVPLGTRLAVGTGITMSDTDIKATTFHGSLNGNATSSDAVKTVTASNTAGVYHITFVDANNGSPTNETVYTDDGIYYNPGANKLTTQHAELTGNLLVAGITTLSGNVNLGDSGSDVITVTGIATFPTSNVYIDNNLYVGNLEIVGGASIGLDVVTRNLKVTGISTIGDASADTLTVNATTTFTSSASFGDGDKLYFGDGNDLEIFHNGENSFIKDVGDGSLNILASEFSILNAAGDENLAVFRPNGSVELYYDNVERLKTANGGVIITGVTTSTGGFSGNLTGDVTGTASTATRATTVDTTATSTDAYYYVPFVDTLAGQTGETIRVGAGLSINPHNGNVGVASVLSVGSVNEVNAFIKAGGGSNALYLYSSGDVSFQAKAVVNEIRSSNNATTLITLNGLDATFANNVTVTGIVTAASFSGPLTGNVTGNINSSGLSTFSSVNVANINSSLGVSALTITGASGAVTASNNLTVNGDLFVNGNTTQINTTELTVEDRTITLGIQTGSTPTTTTWDLGVMMNYGDAGIAKTAGVIWQYSSERFVFAANSDNPVSGNNTTTPVITVANYAPIEIGALWVNDCAGQSQVISCTGGERFLENITVDAGTF